MSKHRKGLKEIWLDEGLVVLEEEGPLCLSIDNLATRLGKTKGSFYHHFQNRDQFIDALLSYYETKTTEDIFREADLEKELEARRKKLREMSFQVSSRLELIIRAWSLYDPVVQKYQDRMDRRRLDYLTRLYLLSGTDRSAAETRAYRNFSLYIGIQQLRHLYSGENFEKFLNNLFEP